MGLDMYVYALEQKPDLSDFGESNWDENCNIIIAGQVNPKEVEYWRKNWQLHDLIHALYTLRTGNKEFNGEYVRLYLRNLESLEEQIKKLDHAGRYDIAEYDLEVIDKLKKLIELGKAIYYYANW